MGYIPKDAKWWVAELVEEITVQGDRRNVVHLNTVLIRADSPDEAHERALALGRDGNTSYRNRAGKKVRIRFRGIAHLDVVHDTLRHGAELSFTRKIGVSEKQIRQWVRSKRQLEAFLPPPYLRPGFASRPDYSSREVLQEVNRRIGPFPEIPRRLGRKK